MHALTTMEAEILSLWDAHLGTREIARRVGLPHRRVSKILSTYADSGEKRAADRSIIAGSKALAAAINRERIGL